MRHVTTLLLLYVHETAHDGDQIIIGTGHLTYCLKNNRILIKTSVSIKETGLDPDVRFTWLVSLSLHLIVQPESSPRVGAIGPEGNKDILGGGQHHTQQLQHRG